jgi:hypothetical protein
MDIIVMGAGAVGAVIGTLLKCTRHRVRYWARADKGPLPAAFEVTRYDGGMLRSGAIEWVGPGRGPVPGSDWILVCVRTEQLTAALAEIVATAGPQRAVAIATVTIDGALTSARAAGITGPVLAFHISFGSEIGEPAADLVPVHWFPFTTPSTVSAEGQRERLTDARTLALQLKAAGLPSSSTLSMAAMMRVMVVSSIALLPSWELCNWDIAHLARDRTRRRQTASSMHELARAFAPERGFPRLLALAVPRGLYALLLRVLPWFMGKRAKRLWHVHGPKVREQTDYVLSELLARGAQSGLDLPHTTALHTYWRQSQTAAASHGAAQSGPAAPSVATLAISRGDYRRTRL